jgi:hypothetical protein
MIPQPANRKNQVETYPVHMCGKRGDVGRQGWSAFHLFRKLSQLSDTLAR